jgi:hypothetical protein
MTALIAAALFAASAAADERGRAVIRQVDAKERSLTARSKMEMSIRPADGGPARNFSVLSCERSGVSGNAAEASYVEFLEPRSVRGLRILSKGSDSWVFFPSTGRVRKIAGSSRSGSVQGVGGDFSYDDLGGGAWEDDYEFIVLREGPAEWELEGTRRSKDAGYDAVRLAVDKNLMLVTKASFSSKKEGGYYKELAFSDFKDFGGRTRAGEMTMRNLKKGSSTRVALLEAEFDLKLEDRLFDPSRFDK